MTTVLVTGGTGQVGTALAVAAWPAGFEAYFPTRAELDLSSIASIRSYLSGRSFDLIVNCAAYTAVDKAESDVALAWQVNALAPAVLAEAAARAEIPMIQLSTDYVFDGKKRRPYLEDDPVAPLNVYGASKEGGEQAVRTACSRHVILRTSWVISPYGHNFVRTILRLAEQRDRLRVVNDQHGAPTSAADIARAVMTIARRIMSVSDASSGTYHCANAGATTWLGVAEAILAEVEARGHARPHLEPITTADYPTAARRPANSMLNCAKLQRDFGIGLRPLRDALTDVVSGCLDREGIPERDHRSMPSGPASM
jgi:dTDP-4-dehydrorhamnose reductase